MSHDDGIRSSTMMTTKTRTKMFTTITMTTTMTIILRFRYYRCCCSPPCARARPCVRVYHRATKTYLSLFLSFRLSVTRVRMRDSGYVCRVRVACTKYDGEKRADETHKRSENVTYTTRRKPRIRGGRMWGDGGRGAGERKGERKRRRGGGGGGEIRREIEKRG